MSEQIIICPHCNGCIMIKKLNCGVFRHGILKKTGKQINPHASKEECQRYVKKGLIEGCGGAFQVIMENGEAVTKPCEYSK